MIIIKHRVNSIEDLINTPNHLGVEIDLRSSDSELIISHDPFSKGVSFKKWLKYYKHAFLILNVKEEGLEKFAVNLLKEFEVNTFFFLDQSMPSLYKMSKVLPELCCSRVSEIESIENVLKLNVAWVWFDSHSGNWEYIQGATERIANTGIKKCLVSPELQRPNYEGEINSLKNLISQYKIKFEAVCTKYPEKWF
jgi:hypothetical protein